MKTILILFAAGSVCLADSEKKIKFEELPAAVQAAAKEQSKGAVVKGYSMEVENGKISYEAEMTVNGHSKDVSFDSTGKVVAVEEETPLDRLPAPAREAIQKAAGSGKVNRVEKVTENGKTFYEASIRTGTKNREVRFDEAGKPVR